MNKTNFLKKKTFTISIFIISLFIAGCIEVPQSENNQSEPSSSSNINTNELIEQLELLCIENDGTWVEGFNECEFISQEVCEFSGGEFIECGSACRNDPNTEMCTMQCVPYCEYNSFIYGSDNINNVGDVIFDSYGNQVPNNCAVWFDGCNTCSVGESGILACTLMFCEEPSEGVCREFE